LPISSVCDTQIMFVRSTNHDTLCYSLFSSLLLLRSFLTEYLLKHPILEHPEHTLSLNVGAPVSHPYKITATL
jgi:hypothetical protein